MNNRTEQIFLTVGMALVVARLAGQTNVFPASGSVGIGTTTPNYALDVRGGIASTINSNEGGELILVNGNKTGQTANTWTLYNMTGPYGNGLSFWRYFANGTNPGPVMFLTDAGGVGIGTMNPRSRLDIEWVDPQLTLHNTNQAGFGSFAQDTYNAFQLGMWDGNTSAAGVIPASSQRTFFAMDVSGNVGSAVNTAPNGSASGVIFRNLLDNGSGNASFAGDVGIGTTSPVGPLDVKVAANGHAGFFPNAGYVSFGAFSDSFAGWLPLSINAGGDTYFAITSGRVGIGTTDPTYPLTVNGTVRAKEVIVDTGWSDYVFKPGYRLAPLSEVEHDIKTHGHLPGIPTAKQVRVRGISVGEMQAKLLAKIEELTLHMIAQEKRIECQGERIRRLENENQMLRTRNSP